MACCITPYEHKETFLLFPIFCFAGSHSRSNLIANEKAVLKKKKGQINERVMTARVCVSCPGFWSFSTTELPFFTSLRVTSICISTFFCTRPKDSSIISPCVIFQKRSIHSNLCNPGLVNHVTGSQSVLSSVLQEQTPSCCMKLYSGA